MNRLRTFTRQNTGMDLGYAFDLIGRASTDESLTTQDKEDLLAAGNRILVVILKDKNELHFK